MGNKILQRRWTPRYSAITVLEPFEVGLLKTLSDINSKFLLILVNQNLTFLPGYK